MEQQQNLLMITKVKNESDIIESFIRYHDCIFDKIIVIDNGSIDGTFEILKALKNEGLNIEIINEGANDFDAFRLVNQYTSQYIQDINADFVIFMDADEFLIADENINPREVIERLSKEKVYYIHWKTYLYNHERNEKAFLPSNFTVYRDETQERYTKIIVPGQLLLKEKIIIKEGNHDFWCERNVQTEFTDSLKFAHFPVRSRKQYVKQILLNVISMMSEPNTNQQTGAHWKKMYQVNEENVDLYSESLRYAFYSGTQIYNGGMKDIFYIEDKIKCKNLSKNNIQQLLLTYLEIQALKLKAERLNIGNGKNNKERILVYGMGKLCEKRVGRIDDRKYEITAFVDSDQEKVFGAYNGKIIIVPEMMRFFPFSKIVIATNKFADEIRERILMELPMLSERDIIDIERFIVNQY